jgi:hypothetical protein
MVWLLGPAMDRAFASVVVFVMICIVPAPHVTAEPRVMV